MLRANLWNESVLRVELDQRARDARGAEGLSHEHQHRREAPAAGPVTTTPCRCRSGGPTKPRCSKSPACGSPILWASASDLRF